MQEPGRTDAESIVQLIARSRKELQRMSSREDLEPPASPQLSAPTMPAGQGLVRAAPTLTVALASNTRCHAHALPSSQPPPGSSRPPSKQPPPVPQRSATRAGAIDSGSDRGRGSASASGASSGKNNRADSMLSHAQSTMSRAALAKEDETGAVSPVRHSRQEKLRKQNKTYSNRSIGSAAAPRATAANPAHGRDSIGELGRPRG